MIYLISTSKNYQSHLDLVYGMNNRNKHQSLLDHVYGMNNQNKKKSLGPQANSPSEDKGTPIEQINPLCSLSTGLNEKIKGEIVISHFKFS